MGRYAIRRLLIAIPTLIGATLLAFAVLRVLPGDVAMTILGGTEGEAAVDPAALAKLRQELGLDKPLFVQYFVWGKDMVTGNFGTSLWTGRPVGGEILHRLPLTLQMALMAEIIAFFVGLPIGIISALKQESFVDYSLRVTSVFFLAVPSFWFGLLILLVGVRFFAWMPPIGYFPIWQDPGQNLTQLIWPALVLASHESARIGRMTRSTMLEVMREDFIRTARSKGLSERMVVFRHALKNTMIPVVTFTAIYFGTLLGGTVVLERVFSIPGLGTLFLDSLNFRDYTMVQALVFFMAVIFILLNLFVDLLYGLLDPRISYT